MAFIQKQNIPLSFTGGLQSKTDALQLQPPALLELQNATFNKIGQLSKRFGYDILPTNIMGGGQITSAFALDVFNNELNLFDNQNIYTFISTNQSWANRGPAISLINTNNQIIRTSAAQQLNPDSAFTDNVEVYVWEDSRGGARFSVLDHQTKSYCVADQYLNGSLAKPKSVVFNNQFYIFYTDNNNLNYRIINPNNPNVIQDQVNCIADGYADFTYDCSVINNKLYVVYQSATPATGAINLFSLDTSNTQSSTTVVDNTAGQSISDIRYATVNVVGDSSNNIWVSWTSGADVRVKTYNSSLSVILAETVVASGVVEALTGIESNTPNILQLTYQVHGKLPDYTQVKTVTIRTDGTITDIGTIRSVGLASKAFRYQNNLYVQLTHESTLQSTYFMVFLTGSPFTITGKVAAQVGGGLPTNGMLGEVNTISPGVFIWANLIKGQFISEDNTNFSLLGVNSTKVDFTNTNKFNSTTQSNNLLFVGGILQSYDGVSVTEQNFHLYPEGTTFDLFTVGGALSVGQYQYQIVYAWTDKFGQVQYSRPSTPITVTSTTPTTSVLLHIPTLRLTAKTNVVIKVYRTQVNGVVFQEVTSELSPLLNNPNVDFVDFADVVADTQMAANGTIYTTGGILANDAPPSCSLITLYQDRVMVSGLEDPYLIWFSKNKFNNTNFNTIPVEFSSSLTVAVSQVGGPITALGLMDDKLIIFKRNSIFVLTGDGPNDLGGGDQFSTPELVTNSIGCTNPNSVVLTKDGIMFQSDKGIWLLDRGLGPPQYIGAGVDDQAKAFTVTSADVDPNDNLIIFTTSNDTALVYDYYINQWSTYTNHQAVNGVIYNNLFAFCKPNGQVYVQNRSKFTDGGKFIPLEFVTPWMSFAGLQGYQRVFRSFLLGTFRSPHSLNISVGYDFSPNFDGYAVINATSVSGGNQWGGDPTWGSSTPWGSTWMPYEFQINFKKQLCTTLRIRVQDNQSSPYLEGYSISSLSFEVGALPDHNRLPIANKVGTQ